MTERQLGNAYKVFWPGHMDLADYISV